MAQASASTSNQSMVTIRDATLDDVDQLVIIIHTIWPQDPYYQYFYPYAGDLPDAYVEFSKQRLSRMIYAAKTHNGYYGKVAQGPSNADPKKTEVVGFAFWHAVGFGAADVDLESVSFDGPKPYAATMQERDRAVKEATKKMEDKWFNSVYGPRRLQLQHLAVHPEHQQRGIGTKLVQNGIKKIANKEIPITLYTTVAGKKLFENLGFKSTGTRPLEVDDKGRYDIEGMALAPTAGGQ